MSNSLNRKGGGSLRRTPLAKGTSTLSSRSSLKSGDKPLKQTGTLKSHKPLSKGDKPLTAKTGLKQGDKLLQAKKPLSQGDKPLQARTTLKSGDKKLSAKTTLSPGDKRLQAKSAMKAKSKTRTPEEVECRKIVKVRSNGICEICGQRNATDMAHRLAVSQGGKWQAANILHACRLCHSNNHDNPQNSFDNGWHLRSGSNPVEEKVKLSVSPFEKAWFFLNNSGEKTLQS